jgi:hypothetical protein
LVHLVLRLGGGGDVGFDSGYRLSTMGKLTAELGIGPRWSIGASAALKRELIYTTTQQHTPLTLFGRAALHAPGKSGFSLAAGLLLDIAKVDSGVEGPGFAGEVTLYELGATASVMWEYPFARRFSFFVDVGLSALFGNGHVSRYWPEVREPQAWVDLSTGLACRFF